MPFFSSDGIRCDMLMLRAKNGLLKSTTHISRSYEANIMDFPVQPTLTSSADGTMTELGIQEVKSTIFFTHSVFMSFV